MRGIGFRSQPPATATRRLLVAQEHADAEQNLDGQVRIGPGFVRSLSAQIAGRSHVAELFLASAILKNTTGAYGVAAYSWPS